MSRRHARLQKGHLRSCSVMGTDHSVCTYQLYAETEAPMTPNATTDAPPDAPSPQRLDFIGEVVRVVQEALARAPLDRVEASAQSYLSAGWQAPTQFDAPRGR